MVTEWEGYDAKVHTYLEDGDRVTAFGVYSGTYRAARKSMTATFAHLYRFKDGRIATIEQILNSGPVLQALI